MRQFTAQIGEREMLTPQELERRAFVSLHPMADLFGQLADRVDADEAIESASVHVEEARGCFPAEDFLQDELSELRGIIRNMRKSDLRASLENLFQHMEDTQSREFQQAEYGADELKKVLALLESAA